MRFSVVVPALDEAADLPDALESLLAQDVAGEVEIIVVDNGSTDATADRRGLVRGAVGARARARSLQRPPGRGASSPG